MKSTVGLWTLIALVYAAGASKWHTGGNGYSYINGYLYERNYNWSQASDECSRKNMSLMIVDSKAKQQELENSLEKDGFYRFMGARYNDVNKRYEWVKTGKPLGYTNWASGKPDKNTKDQCIVIDPNNGRWNNFDCSNKRGFICEEIHLWYDEVKKLKKTIENLQADALVVARRDEELNKTIENVKADVLVGARREEELKKTIAKLKGDVLDELKEQKKTITDLKSDILVDAKREEEQKKTAEILKAEIIELKEQKKETCEHFRKQNNVVLNIGSNQK